MANLVYQFDVGADGTLSYKSPAATVAAGDFASSVVVSADGKSAYVVSVATATISQYDVDATSGALTPKADSSVGVGLQPNQIALSLDGGSAYVTDFGDPITGGGSVWQYNVSTASGTLSRKVPPRVSFAGMTNPWGVAVSGNGEWSTWRTPAVGASPTARSTRSALTRAGFVLHAECHAARRRQPDWCSGEPPAQAGDTRPRLACGVHRRRLHLRARRLRQAQRPPR